MLLTTFLWLLFIIVIFLILQLFVKKFKTKLKSDLKAVDFLVPFLLISLYAESRICFKTSILPYFFISDFLLGIGLAGFMGYSNGEIEYQKFFKTYWRVTSILAMIVDLLMATINVIYLIK